MHPYNRLPSSGHSTPPSSPLRFSPAQPPTRTVVQHLAWVFLSVLLRRQCVFLFAPLIYISGMLLYMGTVSFDVVPIIKHCPSPDSIYRSPELYAKLRHKMDADDSSGDADLEFVLECGKHCAACDYFVAEDGVELSYFENGQLQLGFHVGNSSFFNAKFKSQGSGTLNILKLVQDSRLITSSY